MAVDSTIQAKNVEGRLKKEKQQIDRGKRSSMETKE